MPLGGGGRLGGCGPEAEVASKRRMLLKKKKGHLSLKISIDIVLLFSLKYVHFLCIMVLQGQQLYKEMGYKCFKIVSCGVTYKLELPVVA